MPRSKLRPHPHCSAHRIPLVAQIRRTELITRKPYHWFASATACQVARPPVRIRLERPAFGDFYFQAFNGSVSLPVAGYNYNSDWTPLLAGLSPAGMAASLAARSFATDAFRASVEQCPLCAKSDRQRSRGRLTLCVESRCGAVALGRTYLLPPLSSGGAVLVPPW